MKRLEDAVIPFVGSMMMGETVSLRASGERAAIAIWAIKTAMVFEFTSRTAPVFYTEDERMALRTQLTSPGNTVVLLARTTDIPSFYARNNSAPGTFNGQAAQVHVSTVAYRFLVVQVFSVRTEFRRADRVGLNTNGDWTGCFQLLSRNAPTSWPPARPIPPGSLDAFHRRLLPA